MYSALILVAFLMQACSVGSVTETDLPPSRSWMVQAPDGSFLAFGIFKKITLYI
jgi:hypothetical protein